MFFSIIKNVLCMEIYTVKLGNKAEFSVELARDRPTRAQGLMDRESLALCHGMWFDFGDVRLVSMWMKNTSISLDVVFISEGLVVKQIIENTIPFSLDLLESKAPVRYALEVLSGTSNFYDFSIGDTVFFGKEEKVDLSTGQKYKTEEKATCAL